MNRRWICNDVWMDILPSFDRPQLGLKMALLSDRFDALVDAHFDATTELTLWNSIIIRKDIGPKANEIGPKAELSVVFGVNVVQFSMLDHPLPNKIRFSFLQIEYIDHSVITFLHANKQIWDKRGTKLELSIDDDQPIWDVFIRQIWPIFATNIRHLYVPDGNHLDKLRRLISPTILTDFDQLHSIDSNYLLPDAIGDDGPNTTADQALSKWLHTPTKDGQPKRFRRNNFLVPPNLEWVNNFKETFRRATTSVSYNIQLFFWVEPMPIEPFELENKVTNEKLTLKLSEESIELEYNWLLKRCPIGETAPVRFDPRYGNNACANLNIVRFDLGGNHWIGPLSPPAVVEEELD